MLQLATLTAEAFESTYGFAPEGVWQSPGRVNLIGEHTDYNFGFVLPMAINYATYAAIKLREDNLVRVSSTFSERLVETEASLLASASDWSAYPLGVAHVLGAKTGFDIFIAAKSKGEASFPRDIDIFANAKWSNSIIVLLKDHQLLTPRH